MRPVTKIAIMVVTLFLAVAAFVGVWFILYGLPQVKSHPLTLHNVREDKSAVTYEINGEEKKLEYGDNVAVVIPNNTIIISKPDLQLPLTWGATTDYIDIYFFVESIETNLTMVKLDILNASGSKYWIWVWPSQTRTSVHNIKNGDSAILYTYVGQQLAFSSDSQLGVSPIYFFSPTSVSTNKITLGSSGIITAQI